MIDYETLLHKEVIPALGCTEPIAVAYAAAWARKTMGCEVERIEVYGSRNILKNAMNVGIPGSDLSGLPIAAALGALAGRTDIGLEVLRDVTDKHVKRGKEMVEAGNIIVRQKKDVEPVYIEVRVFGAVHSASAVIQRSHTRLTDLVCDGMIVHHEHLEPATANVDEYNEMTVSNVWQFCMDVPFERITFLKESSAMNMAAAQEGIRGGYGMSVGHNLLLYAGQAGGIMGSDIGSSAVALTAAACDARMAGASVPVMSVAGSGNQGLVCIIPVTVIAQRNNVSEERMLRALALSILITIRIKRGIGRLSALCGCGIAAAVGASCGVLYVLGGSKQQVQYAIKNMVANLTGMVCDGAKSGCAVKVATSVSAAIQSAVLAINNAFVPDMDGIVDKDVEQTIENLGSVGRQGMAQTDQLILDMMTRKA